MHQPQSSLFRRRNEAAGGADVSTGGGYVDAPQAQASPGGASDSRWAAASARSGPTASAAPLSSSSAAAAQERENDAMVKALIADVRRTKESFIKMGAEVERQNTLLDAMGKAFDGARGALTRVMSRLDKASGASSYSHMWALFLFVILVFMFIYLLLKWRR